MPDQEASTVADVLVQGFISRFGIPSQIHSDQGPQFESHLFKSLCGLLGVEKTRTTPYHPQSDGMVERFNRTLEDMLSKVVNCHHRNWDDCLPLAMMAYRSSVHETTGESPVRLMFGREIQLPIDLLLGKCPVDSELCEPNVAYVKNLRDRLQCIHEVTRQSMLHSSDRQKRAYDLRQNCKSYKIGDAVYLHSTVRKPGTTAKFHLPWVGPFLVVGKVSDLIYMIQQSPGSGVKIVYHDRLKPSHKVIESWEGSQNQETMNVLVGDTGSSVAFPDNNTISEALSFTADQQGETLPDNEISAGRTVDHSLAGSSG